MFVFTSSRVWLLFWVFLVFFLLPLTLLTELKYENVQIKITLFFPDNILSTILCRAHVDVGRKARGI